MEMMLRAIVSSSARWHPLSSRLVTRSEKACRMARSIEQERAQLEADEQRLNERRKQLADRERSGLLKEVEKSGLM
jgi:hypothetical protein